MYSYDTHDGLQVIMAGKMRGKEGRENLASFLYNHNKHRRRHGVHSGPHTYTDKTDPVSQSYCSVITVLFSSMTDPHNRPYYHQTLYSGRSVLW